ISRTWPLAMIAQSEALRQLLGPSGYFVDLFASHKYMGGAVPDHGSLSASVTVTHTVPCEPPSPAGGAVLELLHPRVAAMAAAIMNECFMEGRSTIPRCCRRSASPNRASPGPA